jgi:hypothetical protein
MFFAALTSAQEGPPDAPPPASVTAVVVDLPPVSRGYTYLSHFRQHYL